MGNTIVLLGVAVIWLAYFGLGFLFRSNCDEGHREGVIDNSDFV